MPDPAQVNVYEYLRLPRTWRYAVVRNGDSILSGTRIEARWDPENQTLTEVELDIAFREILGTARTYRLGDAINKAAWWLRENGKTVCMRPPENCRRKFVMNSEFPSRFRLVGGVAAVDDLIEFIITEKGGPGLWARLNGIAHPEYARMAWSLATGGVRMRRRKGPNGSRPQYGLSVEDKQRAVAAWGRVRGKYLELEAKELLERGIAT